jgi:hypothetical protein
MIRKSGNRFSEKIMLNKAVIGGPIMSTNLFPLPYWAPALQRVPTPLQVLNEAFILGERSLQGARLQSRDEDERPGFAHVSPIAKTRGKTGGMARRKA